MNVYFFFIFSLSFTPNVIYYRYSFTLSPSTICWRSFHISTSIAEEEGKYTLLE